MERFRNLIQRQFPGTQPVVESTLRIGPGPLVAIVNPCQHAGTRWRAECTTVGMVELHSFVCETVDIWGLEMLLSVAAEHPASEIVCEDENDIRGMGHDYDTKRLKKSSFLMRKWLRFRCPYLFIK